MHWDTLLERRWPWSVCFSWKESCRHANLSRVSGLGSLSSRSQSAFLTPILSSHLWRSERAMRHRLSPSYRPGLLCKPQDPIPLLWCEEPGPPSPQLVWGSESNLGALPACPASCLCDCGPGEELTLSVMAPSQIPQYIFSRPGRANITGMPTRMS